MIIQIIRFSSGSLFVILKNKVRVRLRLDKNSAKPVYKTLVRVQFDSLPYTTYRTILINYILLIDILHIDNLMLTRSLCRMCISAKALALSVHKTCISVQVATAFNYAFYFAFTRRFLRARVRKS